MNVEKLQGAVLIKIDDAVACKIHYWEGCKTPVEIVLNEDCASKLLKLLDNVINGAKNEHL